jgi:hypothetical protein
LFAREDGEPDVVLEIATLHRSLALWAFHGVSWWAARPGFPYRAACCTWETMEPAFADLREIVPSLCLRG